MIDNFHMEETEQSTLRAEVSSFHQKVINQCKDDRAIIMLKDTTMQDTSVTKCLSDNEH